MAMVVVAGCGLAGCFPTLLTSQPKARITVVNESGAPLPGATVTLTTVKSIGLGGTSTRQDFLTDSEGKVFIKKKHAWAMQVYLPDATTSYGWTMCVSKAGYEATPLIWPKVAEPMRISMYASPVQSECLWDDNGRLPRVVRREGRWIEVEGGTWLSNQGITDRMDDGIRAAAEASAGERGLQLHSWSEYRFQFQTRGTQPGVDYLLYVHAFCEAPADFELTKSFYTRADAGTCFFDTTYDTYQLAFGPFKMNGG